MAFLLGIGIISVQSLYVKLQVRVATSRLGEKLQVDEKNETIKRIKAQDFDDIDGLDEDMIESDSEELQEECMFYDLFSFAGSGLENLTKAGESPPQQVGL